MSYERLDSQFFDPHCSLDSVSYHKGSNQEFNNYVVMAVHREALKGPTGLSLLSAQLNKWATDPRSLKAAWDQVATKGGPSPGPNGRRFGNLSDTEVWKLLKALCTALRSGKYLPDPALIVQVNKDPLDSSKGQRSISLINIEDRAVQKSYLNIAELVLRPTAEKLSFSGGPQRGVAHALARLERLAIDGNRWVWISDDVRNAFDNIVRSSLQELLVKRLRAEDFVLWIVKLVDNQQKRGVQQGGPLSPLCLEVYLSALLHGPWKQKFPLVPLLRYVDDLLALCRTKVEATAAYKCMVQLLNSSGMQLKAQNPICDLRKGGEVVWLGIRIRRANQLLSFRVAKKSWKRLTRKLELAHRLPNSPLRAVAIIKGWLQTLGPCYKFENRSRVLARVEKLAASLGFDELPPRKELRQAWKRGDAIWEQCRKDAAAPPQVQMKLPKLIENYDASTPAF